VLRDFHNGEEVSMEGLLDFFYVDVEGWQGVVAVLRPLISDDFGLV